MTIGPPATNAENEVRLGARVFAKRYHVLGVPGSDRQTRAPAVPSTLTLMAPSIMTGIPMTVAFKMVR